MKSRKGFTDINIERTQDLLDATIDRVHFGRNGAPAFATVEISINGACTRRCRFCPRVSETNFPNNLKSLDWQCYQKMIYSLASHKFSGRISFSGFCEPLLTKDIDNYIRFARSALKDIQIEIVSNADCLPNDQEKFTSYVQNLYNAGLSCLRISVYDGEERYKQLDRQFIRAGASSTSYILRKRYLSADLNYGMTISNRAGSVDLSKLGLEYIPPALPLRQPCYYPFYKVFIDFNGNVLLCSNDWASELIVGNIHDQDIYEVWFGDKFIEARKRLASGCRTEVPCTKCDVEGILNGDQFFKAWQKSLFLQ